MTTATVTIGPEGLHTMGEAFKAEGARLRDAEWRAAVERVRASECWPLDGLPSQGFDAALDALLAAMEAK